MAEAVFTTKPAEQFLLAGKELHSALKVDSEHGGGKSPHLYWRVRTNLEWPRAPRQRV